MKALTIREPWASLIINKYKKYEFRSRKTNYRGEILIHAGKNAKKADLAKFQEYHLDYQFGAIIGMATISDCIKINKEWMEERKKENPLIYDKNVQEEEYAWVLTDIKKYKKAIPEKGKLGLWNYKGEIYEKTDE